jgi:8-oxo-dGTP pyrophosphatase MutT (NUDIX family)
MALRMAAEVDNHYRGLVSVKGVLCLDGRCALARNLRGEWELPGGKMQQGENFAECLRREFLEELGLPVTQGRLIDTVFHHVFANIIVVIFACSLEEPEVPRISDEHTDFGWFAPEELDGLNLPDSYRRAVLHHLQQQPGTL